MTTSLIHKAKTAVREPEKVPPYLKMKAVGPLARMRLRTDTAGLPAQRSLMDELRDTDSWLLIVLDACRYDTFATLSPEYIEGQTQRVRSEGYDTFQYGRLCWSEKYPDVTYVSGATPINSRDLKFDEDFHEMYGGWRPRDHIGEIVDVWQSGWKESLGTVPPEAVVQTALGRCDESQLVAHVFQPHAPYIGDSGLLGHANDESAMPGGGEPVDAPIWRNVRQGRISEAELQEVYRSNLRRALEAVCPLIEASDHDRIVLMGDHGEALGEYNTYGHPRHPHPKIRAVPWCDVEGLTLRGQGIVAESTTWSSDGDVETSEADVEERLKSLGYL